MPEYETGSDGQIHNIDTAALAQNFPDEPIGSLVNLDAGPVDPTEFSEPASAAQRLRAFEDEHLGEGAPRISGKLERGHGSLFSRLSPEKQKAHAAIEKTVATEQKLADAHAALLKAEADHNAALDDASRFGG